MPCYRCGVRQTDPERGKSPWRRGVRHDQLVLVCPACQESGDWIAELESCLKCGSVHLIRRLGQVECLDCGLVREPATVLVPSRPGAQDADGTAGDAALAEEVGRALDRLLGRR
ncbi:MAG: hypothetical protein ABSB76_15030 [Streptosporangiaceae bacterium]|jgi:ribosomal protein L32